MKLERHSALRKIEGNVDTDLLQKDPFLRKLVDLFVKEYRPERIYLFGSKARGEAGCYSDYDVMIIVPDDTPKSIRETGRAHKLMWKADLTEPVDVLVWSKSRFEAVTPVPKDPGSRKAWQDVLSDRWNSGRSSGKGSPTH